MIPVTKPFLPPIEEYKTMIDGIWDRQWLTNMGPLANALERQLQSYLNVEELLFVTNGTIALQMAIKALGITGEIITTPFSFVATTSSIVWEGCKPVFVDINPDTLNIDASKIEAAITKDTQAILATHVYGNPCDVEAIEIIAKKHNLKVIYDGAHAFGVQVNGKSIFEYGDITTCSLHATKLYHSIEGGFIVCKDKDVVKQLKYIRNFGISGYDTFANLGLNGKNSEFHAAMGLVNLKHIDAILDKRKQLAIHYDQCLAGLKAYRPLWHVNSENNNAYYPIVLESEALLLEIKSILDENEIFTRRYFYPSLSTALPYVQSSTMPNSENIAKRVLCLPIYFELTNTEVEKICKLITDI